MWWLMNFNHPSADALTVSLAMTMLHQLNNCNYLDNLNFSGMKTNWNWCEKSHHLKCETVMSRRLIALWSIQCNEFTSLFTVLFCEWEFFLFEYHRISQSVYCYSLHVYFGHWSISMAKEKKCSPLSEYFLSSRVSTWVDFDCILKWRCSCVAAACI